MRGAAFALLVCLFACSAANKPEPEEPTDEVRQAYEETSERLLARFLEAGQVVSRAGDGTPRHFGDSLLWTGMALGVLPCARTGAVEQALAANVETNGGHVVRFRPLPPEYAGREASLDGELGLLWGLAHYRTRCGSLPAWFSEHYAAVSADGWIYPGAAKLIPEFTYVLDALAHRAGLRGAPHADRLRLLAAEVAAWALATKVKRAACYRVHLGWLTLSAVEALGEDVSGIRGSFCAASEGLDLPVVDHWCGRGGLGAYLESFRFDEWEMRHQRCPAWESPDGNGLETPALDRLVGLTQLFGGLQ